MKVPLRAIIESAAAFILGAVLYHWVLESPDMWLRIRPVADLMALWLMVAEPILGLVATASYLHRRISRG